MRYASQIRTPVNTFGLTRWNLKSEYLTVIPKRYIIVRQHRHKYRCTKCHGDIVTTPPIPRVIPGSSYSDEMIIDAALSKYCDLIPMERYCQIAKRQGFEGLPPQSLIAATFKLADFLKVAYERLRLETLDTPVLLADETTHRMLEGDEKTGWHLWRFSTEESCFYVCHDTRSGDVATTVLNASTCSVLVSDVYAGYKKAVREANELRHAQGQPLIQMAFCNSHASRGFKSNEFEASDDAEFMVDNYKKPLSIGVDLGLTNTATLSNGSTIQGPRSLSQSLDNLAKANKSLHRKEKGSKNRRKAAQKVARLHTDIANVRRDFTEKLSTQLLKKYDIIGIEDLNVYAMMKSGRMSRSLADASLGALVGALERKQTKYGALVIQVDRFFPSSQLCRKCQVKNQDLTLGDRIFRCVSPTCQHQEDRDLNAARNIHREALRLVPRATGEVRPVEVWSLPPASSDGGGKLCLGSRKQRPRGAVTSNATQRQKSARSENLSDQI